MQLRTSRSTTCSTPRLLFPARSVSPRSLSTKNYDATCNTSITVPAASGVLANDVDPDATPPLSNTGVTAVSLDTGATSGYVTLGDGRQLHL